MKVWSYVYTALVAFGLFVMASPIVIYWTGETTTVGYVMLGLSLVLPMLFVRRSNK